MMLHLIFQAPLEDAVLERVGQGDALVFMERAVWNALEGHTMQAGINKLQARYCQCYILRQDMEVNGIAARQLTENVTIIDYSDLVALTTKCRMVMTWR